MTHTQTIRGPSASVTLGLMLILVFAGTTGHAQQSAISVSAPTFDEALAAHKQRDYVTSLKGFRILAEQGNALAQANLGFMYENGIGVPQSDAEAVRWFRMAFKVIRLRWDR